LFGLRQIENRWLGHSINSIESWSSGKIQFKFYTDPDDRVPLFKIKN
jgi:hypothetical protein